MAKASRPGFTKTRLSPPLTPSEAARFNTAFLSDIAANLLAAATQCSLSGYMAYAPVGAGDFFQFLPPDIGLFEACAPQFGACLVRAIEELFGRGHAAAGVLNADSPTLPPAFLVEAVEMLAKPGDRAVLGPSSDGGYYFLGLKHVHARLFEDIAWSTEHVARQTLARAKEIGLPVHILPTWYDVDDAETLALLDAELRTGLPAGAQQTTRAAALNSRALIDELSRDAGLKERLRSARLERTAG